MHPPLHCFFCLCVSYSILFSHCSTLFKQSSQSFLMNIIDKGYDIDSQGGEQESKKHERFLHTKHIKNNILPKIL